MKKITILSLLTLLSLTTMSSFAQACETTEQTVLAKKLKLNGAVSITQENESESDKGVVLRKTSDEYKAMISIIGSNYTLVSKVFSFEGEGAAGVVVQNKISCALSFYGFDGEDTSINTIENISTNSITYNIEGGHRVEIKKTKKNLLTATK